MKRHRLQLMNETYLRIYIYIYIYMYVYIGGPLLGPPQGPAFMGPELLQEENRVPGENPRCLVESN